MSKTRVIYLSQFEYRRGNTVDLEANDYVLDPTAWDTNVRGIPTLENGDHPDEFHVISTLGRGKLLKALQEAGFSDRIVQYPLEEIRKGGKVELKDVSTNTKDEGDSGQNTEDPPSVEPPSEERPKRAPKRTKKSRKKVSSKPSDESE